jgi:hypothetical protein
MVSMSYHRKLAGSRGLSVVQLMVLLRKGRDLGLFFAEAG